MDQIYLDYNATTPIDPFVSSAMFPFITDHFGNPSSGHLYGNKTHEAVEISRQQVAELLNCKPSEIIFTSGGTEANNYALKGVVGAYKAKGNHIITSSVEHPAITEVCRYLETQGCKTTYLPVDKCGMINPSDVESAITNDTILITIMHANNEVGTIQPIKEISNIAHKYGVLFHSDCAQSIGKIEVMPSELGVDLLSIAGHKLYAPKGVGALFVRQGVELERQMHGANHERGFRAGTENVIEIVGLGKACQLISQNLPQYIKTMKTMRDRLEAGLRDSNIPLKIHGHPEFKLPNTCSVGFKNIEADELLVQLTKIAASAGAACHTDNVEISSVLSAMKIPMEYAMGTIRLSVGRSTTEQEIDLALGEIQKVINEHFIKR
ncbi:MAG: cysteine desulfurase family protein [Chloroflexota bacterium]|nr:cysteine desulfurase family protein [Chloroflexota bacterium]